jgi:hypothetical protein
VQQPAFLHGTPREQLQLQTIHGESHPFSCTDAAAEAELAEPQGGLCTSEPGDVGSSPACDTRCRPHTARHETSRCSALPVLCSCISRYSPSPAIASGRYLLAKKCHRAPPSMFLVLTRGVGPHQVSLPRNAVRLVTTTRTHTTRGAIMRGVARVPSGPAARLRPLKSSISGKNARGLPAAVKVCVLGNLSNVIRN